MIRRLILPLIIVMAIIGVFLYSRWRTTQASEIRERCAQATAHIWLATATFRDAPEQFLTFRDSVLRDHDLTVEEVQAYTSQDAAEPERYAAFVARVNDLVDSLVAVRTQRSPVDSADQADSVDTAEVGS